VLEQALKLTRRIFHRGRRAEALQELAQQFPVEAALEVARIIDIPLARGRALAEIAGRLPPSTDRSNLAIEAVDAVRVIDDAVALVDVAQRLPMEARPAVLLEALAMARGIEDARSRDQALAEVAPRLSK
jgi:hypothetical protein